MRFIVFCINKKGQLIKLIVSFFISDVLNSDDSLFSRDNNMFFLMFRVENIKHLCHTFSECLRVTFVTYIVEVNEGETVFIQLYTVWILHPMTLKYGDL
jgi:hypothetical protein